MWGMGNVLGGVMASCGEVSVKGYGVEFIPMSGV